MEKYCISVDWLQVYCMGNLLEPKLYVHKDYVFKCRSSNKETALFRNMWYIELNGLPCAIVEQTPRSSAIKAGTTLIKIENRVLYSQQYIKILYALINVLDLTYKGITRLDLCYDCNYFAGHRSPSRFVNNYVLKSVGEQGSVYRKGSDRFTCHGSRSASSSSKITSISYGSPNSRIRSYMYDKTLELLEVKDKPWIRNMWKDNGLVSDDSTHVWRSEISIKSEGMDLLNMQSGQLFKLSPEYLEHYDNLVKIFHYYSHKVFDFRICDGQQLKRNYKSLYLFESSCDITCKPYYISRSADTGRMEKICYNKLKSLAETYTDLSEGIRKSLHDAMDFLQHLSGVKIDVTRANAYRHYLESLTTCQFFTSLDYAYIDAVESMRTQRNNVDAMLLHQYLNNSSIFARDVHMEAHDEVDLRFNSKTVLHPDRRSEDNIQYTY